MVVDMDEFMYSPTYPTVWHYLELLENWSHPPFNTSISQVHVLAVRYGTSGLAMDSEGTIVFDPRNDAINLSVSNPNDDNDTGIYLLFTVSNPKRAPHRDLDDDYEARYNETCRGHEYATACEHALGKSLWKPEHCHMGDIHYCPNLIREQWIWADVSHLRLYHYALKTAAHVGGLLGELRDIKAVIYNTFDEAWFSSRYDPMPDEMVERIQGRINDILLSQ